MYAPQDEFVSEEVVEEEILDEVWGDAFSGAREDNAKDAARKAKIKPAKPKQGGAGNLGSTGDALGARMTDGNKPPVKKPQFKGPGGDPSGSGKGQAQQNKPKGDLLSTFAKSGSKNAQAVQAKLKSKQPTSTPTPTPKPKSTPTPKTTPVKTTPSPAAKPSAAPKDRMANASKSQRMATWAKANPSLANKPKPTPGASAAMSAAKPAPKPNVNGMKSGRLATALSSVKKFKAEETIMNDFDIILEHLVEQGFPVEEALKLMVNMPGEKQEEILENRRAARSAGGYVDDSKKQTDPSKDGFTGISGSIKDIMRQNKEIEAKKKKMTKKEEMDSLFSAYQSMLVSEEESDARKDRDLERGGHSARTDYSKPPKASSGAGAKKRSSMSAIEKVKADMEAKYGKGSIIDTTKKKG